MERTNPSPTDAQQPSAAEQSLDRDTGWPDLSSAEVSRISGPAGCVDILRRVRAFLKGHCTWAYTRGKYAAEWVWKGLCKPFIKVPKADAVGAAMNADNLVLPNCSACDLSEFIHGFVDGHRVQRHGVQPHRDRITAVMERNAFEVLLKCRYGDLALPLLLKKSIAMKYHGASSKDWRMRNNLGESYSKLHTERCLKEVHGWKPQPSFTRGNSSDVVCEWLHLLCKDNKEFYFSLKHVRIRNGKKEESLLYHTVTGECLPLPASAFADLEFLPRESVWLPKDQQIDLATKFPMARSSATKVLQAAFLKKVLVARSDPQKLLDRPEPSRDKWSGDRQVTFHEPVLLDIGTVHQDDCETVMKDALDRYPGLVVVACDNQFLKNCWSVQCKKPDEFKRILLLPGELHGHMHLVHAIFVCNWTYIMEPICLLLGATKVHVNKFLAKEHNEKQRLLFLTFAAGVHWLCEIGLTDAELNDIPKLLKKIESNQPAYDFIFFLFYYANHYVESVNATRTSDNVYADFSWIYNLYIYGITNKNHYKMLCLLFGQVSTCHQPMSKCNFGCIRASNSAMLCTHEVVMHAQSNTYNDTSCILLI